MAAHKESLVAESSVSMLKCLAERDPDGRRSDRQEPGKALACLLSDYTSSTKAGSDDSPDVTCSIIRCIAGHIQEAAVHSRLKETFLTKVSRGFKASGGRS